MIVLLIIKRSFRISMLVMLPHGIDFLNTFCYFVQFSIVKKKIVIYDTVHRTRLKLDVSRNFFMDTEL